MFSWDIRKAISNFEKHGVSFEEAVTTFDDAVWMFQTLTIRRQKLDDNGWGCLTKTGYF